jgi:putative addiction module component (TIGR02574 family)
LGLPKARPEDRLDLSRFAGEVTPAQERRYNGAMTQEQIKAVLDRVLTWPPERQEDAAEILASLEAQDGSPLRLTAEQAAEVRRRLADPRPGIPVDEVFKRLRPSQ